MAARAALLLAARALNGASGRRPVTGKIVSASCSRARPASPHRVDADASEWACIWRVARFPTMGTA
jgi:hypothetical protein